MKLNGLATATRRISNLAFWLFNTTIVSLFMVAPDNLRSPWPVTLVAYCIGFAFLDFMAYLLHRLFHAIPDGWRFHALHHSDPAVDITTSVRHHPIEYLLTSAIFWVAVFAVGIPAQVVLAYGLVVMATTVASHAAVTLPKWLERPLRWIVITPSIHLLHHSADPVHANTNFGEVFSIWDRLLRTYALPCDNLRYGVREIDPQDACYPGRMLLTPLRIRNMCYFSDTHHLSDGREIQVSADMRGKVVRLRAMLVDRGIVQIAHSQDYRGDNHQTGKDIERFTKEFEEISGIASPRELFLFGRQAAA